MITARIRNVIDWCRNNPAKAILVSVLAMCLLCGIASTGALVIDWPLNKKGGSIYQTATIVPPSLVSQGQEAQGIPTDQVAGECCQVLGTSDEGKLLDWSRDTDTTRALPAAWRLWVEPLDPSRPRRPQRFFGFVEGRAGVSVPVRWQLAVIQYSLARDRDALRHEMDPYLKECTFLKKDAPYPGIYMVEPESYRLCPGGWGWQVAADLVVRQDSPAAVILTQGTKSVRLMSSDLRRSTLCRAVLGTDVTVMAFYEQSGDSYWLHCFDSRSGRLRWKSLCWGGPFALLRGGFKFHAVHLAIGKAAVCACGSGGSIYTELFDLQTGASQGRFSSNAWGKFRP
jgi:hypothetical protein